MIAAFIQHVLDSRVDLVNHPEGAFQTLSVPKLHPYVAGMIADIFAIAPPAHGTTLVGIYNVAYIRGQASRKLIGDLLEIAGCEACDDLGPQGPAMTMLNSNGPITQPEIRYTILMSTHDEIITPPETAVAYNQLSRICVFNNSVLMMWLDILRNRVTLCHGCGG